MGRILAPWPVSGSPPVGTQEKVEDIGRRARLHELDTMLDALERLNLQDSNTLPEHLRDSLRSVGLEVAERANVTELIERIWEMQERYLAGSHEVQQGAGESLQA